MIVEKSMDGPADLTSRTASDLARLVRGREASAVEVALAHLARIDRVNPRVNAIVSLDAEGALADARAVDAALAAGRDVGLLAGVPFSLKDMHLTRGLPTTLGLRARAGVGGDRDGV